MNSNSSTPVPAEVRRYLHDKLLQYGSVEAFDKVGKGKITGLKREYGELLTCALEEERKAVEDAIIAGLQRKPLFEVVEDLGATQKAVYVLQRNNQQFREKSDPLIKLRSQEYQHRQAAKASRVSRNGRHSEEVKPLPFTMMYSTRIRVEPPMPKTIESTDWPPPKEKAEKAQSDNYKARLYAKVYNIRNFASVAKFLQENELSAGAFAQLFSDGEFKLKFLKIFEMRATEAQKEEWNAIMSPVMREADRSRIVEYKGRGRRF